MANVSRGRCTQFLDRNPVGGEVRPAEAYHMLADDGATIVGYVDIGPGPMDDEVEITLRHRPPGRAPYLFKSYGLAIPDGEAQPELEWGNFVVEPTGDGRVRVAALVADYTAAAPRVKARCDAYIDLATGLVTEGEIPAESQVQLVELPQHPR